MKIIPSLLGHHYLARFSVFLIMAALIVGMVGCGSFQYSITIYHTEGGWAWAPGGPTSNLDYGTVVSIEALAYICYEFVNWTGDVGTIADVESPYTTITMKRSYVITANFVPKAVESVEIWDWYDLDAIRDNLCWNYTLMNDLNSTTAGYGELASSTANGGKGWQPIGTETNSFEGSFDGQGYEIKDLFINRPSESGVGLFGGVDKGVVIKNLGVVNVTVTGMQGVGGLVGGGDGNVSNSYSTGSVTGYGSLVGGLVGLFYGTVSNSHSTASITGNNSYSYVGGLVGLGYGVSNSYATGNVTGGDCVGGLVGADGGGVSNSYATGNVTGGDYVGGLVGINGGTVSNSYSEGSVTGDSMVGGLVGDNLGTVSYSFWDIQTSGQNVSDGGTGKNTTEMKDIMTFSGAGWNITAVALNETNPAYIWNIVNNVTYPFLSWQS